MFVYNDYDVIVNFLEKTNYGQIWLDIEVRPLCTLAQRVSYFLNRGVSIG